MTLLAIVNGQLADPMNKFSREIKKISSNRKKTDEHYLMMSQFEWVGGLYLDEDNRPCIPGIVLDGMLAEAAKKLKLGKVMKSAAEVLTSPLIEHDGPKKAKADDLKDLPRYKHSGPVKVGTSKVIRTRPMFPVWSLEFDVQIDTEALEGRQLKDVIEKGGRFVGLGDFRPRFGKFVFRFMALIVLCLAFIVAGIAIAGFYQARF